MANMAPLEARIRRHGLGLTDAAAREAALRTANAAPKVTGALERGIEAVPARADGDTITATVVGREPYTRYVDEGTGIFGPRRARIFPKRGRFLVFEMAGVPGTIFAKSVAGQPGQKFFHEPMPTRWHDALLAHTGRGNTFSS